MEEVAFTSSCSYHCPSLHIPPLIVGGNDNTFNGVVDVSIYNVATDTWNLVDRLKTARAYSIVAAVDDNAIIVIGGCHEARNLTTCKASAIKTVEIRQAVPEHTQRLLWIYVRTYLAS